MKSIVLLSAKIRNLHEIGVGILAKIISVTMRWNNMAHLGVGMDQVSPSYGHPRVLILNRLFTLAWPIKQAKNDQKVEHLHTLEIGNNPSEPHKLTNSARALEREREEYTNFLLFKKKKDNCTSCITPSDVSRGYMYKSHISRGIHQSIHFLSLNRSNSSSQSTTN